MKKLIVAVIILVLSVTFTYCIYEDAVQKTEAAMTAERTEYTGVVETEANTEPQFV